MIWNYKYIKRFWIYGIYWWFDTLLKLWPHKLIILQSKKTLIDFKVLRIQKENLELRKYIQNYNIFYDFEHNPISCFNYLKELLKKLKYMKCDYVLKLINLDVLCTIEDLKQDLENLTLVRFY